jgi:ABC-type nitrate/sulfonate/bicarbonate transport system substrate-binding protein
MTPLSIGGVPEHFNFPWHLCAAARDAERLGIAAEWRDYPGGSGAMAQALRTGEIDAALLLTEGAVAGAASGGFEIASFYTDSPLIWGIHVPAASALRVESDVRGRRYAISRHGSGSHLMAFVHARQQGWPVDALELVSVGNLAGAIAAFAEVTADVFFWEKFMTKPLVDEGQFRRVGEFVAPWPAFVLCVATTATSEQRVALARLYAAVLEHASALAARSDAAELIGTRYGLDPIDVAAWLETTRWSRQCGIVPAQLAAVSSALAELQLVPRGFEPGRILTKL